MKYAETEANDMGEILMIGYGNTLRCDDGAGVKLAERLAINFWSRGVPVRLLTVTQLVPELAAEIARSSISSVVFVDAATTLSGDSIQVRQIDAARTSPGLGHHLDPTALLTYAKMLYERDAPAWLVTVPGVDFDHGVTISPTIQRLINNAQEIAVQLLQKIEACVPCTN